MSSMARPRTDDRASAEEVPAGACWSGPTGRWLRGQATREARRELLASTLEHVLRTFGTIPDATEVNHH